MRGLVGIELGFEGAALDSGWEFMVDLARQNLDGAKHVIINNRKKTIVVS